MEISKSWDILRYSCRQLFTTVQLHVTVVYDPDACNRVFVHFQNLISGLISGLKVHCTVQNSYKLKKINKKYK